MTTFSLAVGARTTATITATLASAGFDVSPTQDVSSIDPLGMWVEFTAAPGTASGNRQAVLYMLSSLDNSTFSSGASASGQPNMTLIQSLFFPAAATAQRKITYVDNVPPYFQFVVNNDAGVTLSAIAIYYALVTGNSV